MGIHARASASLIKNTHTRTHARRMVVLLSLGTLNFHYLTHKSDDQFAMANHLTVYLTNKTTGCANANSVAPPANQRTSFLFQELKTISCCNNSTLLHMAINYVSSIQTVFILMSHVKPDALLKLATEQTVTLDPVAPSQGRSIKHNLKDVKTILRGRD